MFSAGLPKAKPWRPLCGGSRLPVAALLLVCLAWGCRASLGPVAGGPAIPPIIENPLFVPVVDGDFAWTQLVDTVDDYFRIEREERVRVAGGVVIEGRIDTYPRVGSTLLEPWRKDSTGSYEKMHATLQSIRRRAAMRVIPVGGGFLIDLAVYKEVESLSQPENSSISAFDMRHDSSLDRPRGNKPGFKPVNLGWIPLGRDTALEQRMLAEIEGRLKEKGLPVPVVAPR